MSLDLYGSHYLWKQSWHVLIFPVKFVHWLDTLKKTKVQKVFSQILYKDDPGII